jgi:hypothetical protein
MRHEDGLQAASERDDTTTRSEKKPTKKAPDTNVVTLAAICKELKVDPTAARVKLRSAAADKKIKHKAKSAWAWEKGELKMVRALLKD